MKQGAGIAVCLMALLLDALGAAPARSDAFDGMPDLVQTCKAARFNRNGAEYCGPVAVSNSLIWLSRNKLLPWPHASPEDQYALVRKLAGDRYMGTDKRRGTGAHGLSVGLEHFLLELGVKAFTIKHCGWRSCKQEFNDPAALSLQWIENHIKGNQVQWLNVGWYRKENGHLYRFGGHWLTVVGFREGQCHVLDPAPRNGVERTVHRLTIAQARAIALRGETRGLPETSEEMLEIQSGFTFKRTADVCLIDSAVSLEIR